MICGYSGKLLEIDLTNSNIKEFRLNDALLKEYIGGRGLAVKILWDRLGRKWEKINPLKAENILLFLTGPLTGFFPGGRICVSGKSPQSNGVVGSTVAGEFGVELKCAGYDGILITGEAENPVYLFIKEVIEDKCWYSHCKTSGSCYQCLRDTLCQYCWISCTIYRDRLKGLDHSSYRT